MDLAKRGLSETIGRKIEKAQIRLGFSDQKIADRALASDLKCEPRDVEVYREGRRLMDIPRLILAAESLGVTTDYLLDLE